MPKPLILGLVGATASGKTALSVMAAHEMHGEVVCMDSMQIYRRMNIGTAKPTIEEMENVPHHMLDVADPCESYSVSRYAEEASAKINDILSRGAVPVLCGGTGLYLRALSMPLDFGGVQGDEAVREKYQRYADENGVDKLHDLLSERDPVTAQRLHQNDVRRVIRALEVGELTGQMFSAQVMPTYEDGPYRFLLYAIDHPRDILYERIERRVDVMLHDGLYDEVRGLAESGVPADAQSMQGLGYKELLPVLRGEEQMESAVAMIKQRTRNYAKRQLTWFRHDERVKFLSGTKDEMLDTIINDWKRER